MNATAEVPKLTEGTIVLIMPCGSRFTDHFALIIDMNSDHRPGDGPIAVYFDREVPDYQFPYGEKWQGGIPTKENYRTCNRIMCFNPNELKLVDEIPIEILLKRKFPKGFWQACALPFPLVSGKHECHVAACTSGALATRMTFINTHGVIQNFYACEECHKKYDGIWTDGVTLKDPLPGAPPRN